MNYDELKETIVGLIENNEITEFQLEVALEWLQGNGYIDRSKTLDK